MRSELALALAVALTGCPPQRAPCRPAFAAGAFAVVEPVVTVERTVRLELPDLQCEPEDPTIFTAHVTARNPLSTLEQNVPATLALRAAFVQADPGRVELDLTGLEPGTWDLRVFLEPTLGAFDTTLRLATDRRATPRLPSARAGCAGRTPLGTIFCPEPSDTVIIDARGQATRRPGAVFAVGDVTWRYGLTSRGWELDRARELDAGFFVVTHGPVPISSPTAEVADRDHFWAGTTFVTALDDGGLELSSPMDSVSARHRLVSAGRPIELVEGTCDGSPVQCLPPLERCDRLSARPCVPLSGSAGFSVIGASSSALWVRHQFGMLGAVALPITEASAVVPSPWPGAFEVRTDLFEGRLRQSPPPFVAANAGVLYIEVADGGLEAWPARGSLVGANDVALEFNEPDGGASFSWR